MASIDFYRLQAKTVTVQADTSYSLSQLFDVVTYKGDAHPGSRVQYSNIGLAFFSWPDPINPKATNGFPSPLVLSAENVSSSTPIADGKTLNAAYINVHGTPPDNYVPDAKSLGDVYVKFSSYYAGQTVEFSRYFITDARGFSIISNPDDDLGFTTRDSANLNATITVIGSLFTEKADAVNFNALTDGQRANAVAGADLYRALGGDDTVTLPEATVIAGGGKTVAFDRTHPFAGGAGNDRITGSTGGDWIAGDDGIFGEASTDGNDTLYGLAGDDHLAGAGGDDYLVGGKGKDYLGGGSGDDVLWAAEDRGEVDELTGGPGRDTFVVDDTDIIRDFEVDDVIIVPSRTSTDGIAAYFDGRQTFIYEFAVGADVPSETITLASPISTTRLDARIVTGGTTPGLEIRLRDSPVTSAADKLTLNYAGASSFLTLEIAKAIADVGLDKIKDFARDKAVETVFADFAAEHVAGGIATFMARFNTVVKTAEVVTTFTPVFANYVKGEYKTSEALAEACVEALADVVIGDSTVALGKLLWQRFATNFVDNFKSVAHIFQLGGVGDDVRQGAGGADFFYLQGGDNRVDGGGGVDTSFYDGNASMHGMVREGDHAWVRTWSGGPAHLDEPALLASNAFDSLISVEKLAFADGTVVTANMRSTSPFEYIASFTDIEATFGRDAGAAKAHMLSSGLLEGRVATFDGLSYIAAHVDLMAAFGANEDAGALHWLNAGRFEGRQTRFDGYNYLATYGDLRATFGADVESGTAHYIQYGHGEGRAPGFDSLSYIASYTDLSDVFGTNAAAGSQHFIQAGSGEGRKITFDPMQYVASHDDLIRAFGTDATAASAHYVAQGRHDGHAADTFDAAQYLRNYADLRAAFGTDEAQATLHFIRNGYAEGRSDDLLG